MERDPVRFVWQSAPALNACLLALALLAIPSLWVVLDLLRTAIDDAALGRVFQGRATAPFMRYAVVLPRRIAENPILLLGGFTVTRVGLAASLLSALLASAAATGIFLAVSSLVQAEIGRRALARIERRILDGIASAPTEAAEGARRIAALASDALAGRGAFLGRAIGTPSLAGALLIGCLAFLANLEIWIAVVALAGLAAFAWAGNAGLRLRSKRDAADLAANDVFRRTLSDLADHLSAVAAHGTADLEHRRILAEMQPIRLPGNLHRRGAILLSGVTVGLGTATVASVLGAGAWFGLDGRLSPGQVASAAVAAALAVAALDRLVRWRGERDMAAPVIGQIARELGAFNSRRPAGEAPILPASGVITAERVAAEGAARGGALLGLNLSFPLPSHVALVGDPDSGARTFAGLLGGQILQRAGHLTFGGVEIGEADPADRAQRLAFCGGETLLLANTLRANLLYGCRDPEAADIDERIASALDVAGLRGFVYRRGLSGTIDPRREPGLAAAIVAARGSVRAELERSGTPNLVQPFDTERYNPQATIGENILFGVSLGDTFREENLAAHPFMRSLFDRESLTTTLAELGAAIARNDLEVFSGLPSQSAIVGRFSLLTGTERDEFEAILARQAGGHRGSASARDTARSIGLAMRYSESRHRLGLVGPDLEDHLLRLRHAFAREIPKSLEPSVEFFHPDRLCSATSLLDNLLFGRIAEDQADARPQVLAAIRRALEGLDLLPDIMRVGLQTRIDPGAAGFPPARRAAIDLARCLLRRPDNLIIEHPLDELAPHDPLQLARRLTGALRGRGLVAVVPAELAGAADLFDEVVTFRLGKAVAGQNLPADNARPFPPVREGRAARLLEPEPTWSPL